MLAWVRDRGEAVECEGGHKVTGVWAFASGGRHATWIGCTSPLFRADGTPADEDGRQAERTFLVPHGAVTWTDIWNVVGLRGTASDQFAVTDLSCRPTIQSRDFSPAKERRESGPLYRMSAMTCYEVGFAGVALGIARARSTTSSEFARGKVVRGGRSPIRDNAVVQSSLAQAEIGVRTARAYLLQELAGSGRKSRPGRRSRRSSHRHPRASTNAIHKAREAVDFAYNAAGASAIFESHPLERRFRDIHTVTAAAAGPALALRDRRRLDAGRRGRSHLRLRRAPCRWASCSISPSSRRTSRRPRSSICEVLGLENGDRPPLGFPGYWLYSGGVPTVHLLGPRKPREGIVVRGTKKKFKDTGRFDHIAFAGTDIAGVRKKLERRRSSSASRSIPRTGGQQIFLYDPDGVGVEINFRRRA